MTKIQRIVEKAKVIEKITNSKEKWNKTRGLKREITVFCNDSRNPDYSSRHVKRQMTLAGVDYNRIQNNYL